MTCHRCGTTNRAGTAFCTSCGAPLVSGVQAATAAPPGGAAGGSAAGSGGVHRMSLPVVMGVMLGMVLLAAAAGTVQALRNQDVAPQHLAALAAPPQAAGAPAGPTPLATAGGGVHNDVVAVQPAPGWSVQHNEATDLVLRGPDGVVEWFTVAGAPSGTTVETVALDDVLQAEHLYAQANLCENPVDGTVQNQPGRALLYGVCYTLAAQAGAAVPVEEMHETALVSASNGTKLLYEIVITCARAQCAGFTNQVRPVLASTAWLPSP